MGIADFVDVLVTSEEVGEEKPGKKMFSLVLEKLNMSSVEVLMVGNNVERDIKGAESLGIKAILYDEGKTMDEDIKRQLL